MTSESSDKPVILLVHEAFHRPVHYESVSGALRDRGFTVVVPALATTGTRAGLTYEDDVAAIEEVLAPLLNEGREVVIVAHSFGALPASQCTEGESVAERAECGLKGGVKHYINVCGLAYPKRGKNITGGDEEFPLQHYHIVKDGLIHLRDTAKPVFFSDLSPEQVEDIWPTLVKTHSHKNFSKHPKFVDKEMHVPKTYVFCQDDLALPAAYQTYFVQMGGYQDVIRVPSGHFPFLKIPERMVEIISGIAERK